MNVEPPEDVLVEVLPDPLPVEVVLPDEVPVEVLVEVLLVEVLVEDVGEGVGEANVSAAAGSPRICTPPYAGRLPDEDDDDPALELL